MTTRQSRTILLIAFLLSLLIHAIVGLVVHGFSPSTSGPREIVTKARVLQITHATPKPARTPPPRVVRKSKPAAKPIQSLRGRARAIAAATPPPTPPPTPVASSTPPPGRCQANSIPATLLASPPPPDIPLPVRADETSGTAHINVSLDAQGSVIGTAIVGSSGNPSLDLVAVTMARAAQYSPALVNCKPIPAIYAFTAKFVAW